MQGKWFIGYVTAIGKRFTDVTFVYSTDGQKIATHSDAVPVGCLDPGWFHLEFDAVVWGEVLPNGSGRILDRLPRLMSPVEFVEFIKEAAIKPHFERVYKDIL